MLRRSALSHWLYPVVVVATVSLLLLTPIGFGSTEFAHVFENACHAPLFAVVAMGLALWLQRCNWPRRTFGQYLCALFLAVLLGGGGEIAQSFTGSRDAEWVDVGNDFLGAMAGLCLYALYDRRQVLGPRAKRTLCVSILMVAILVALPIGLTSLAYWQRWRQLPQLVSWSSSAGFHFVTANSAVLHVEALPRPSGAGGNLAMHVSPLREGRWAGISIEEPWPDWSQYSRLAVEVVNPNEIPVAVILRVNDRDHNNTYDDRFNRRFDIAALTRTTLTISLVEVQAAPKLRQLDLKKIALVVLFQDAERGALPFYVGNVSLIR